MKIKYKIFAKINAYSLIIIIVILAAQNKMANGGKFENDEF